MHFIIIDPGRVLRTAILRWDLSIRLCVIILVIAIAALIAR